MNSVDGLYQGVGKSIWNITLRSFWRWELYNIPPNAQIRKAHLELTSPFAPTVPIHTAFQRLKRDGKWNKINGFDLSNYINGSALNHIDLNNPALDWYIADPWTAQTTVISTDISDLVQRHVMNSSGSPFGLTWKYLDVYGVAWNARNAYQHASPDFVRLHVEWDNPPSHTVPSEVSISDFEIDEKIDDAYTYWDLSGSHGDCWDGDLFEKQLKFGFYSLNDAFWRWELSDIPPKAIIHDARLTLTAYATRNSESDLELNSLVPDGMWDGGNGFAGYPDLWFTGIPFIESDDWPIGPWEKDVEYTSFNIRRLVHNFVKSTWDDDYDYMGNLVNRNYEYEEGDHFGLGGISFDTLARVTYQDNDGIAEGKSAVLHVEWTPRDYYETSYYLNQNELDPEKEYRTSNSGNKGYWRWGLTIPKYAVIQSAVLEGTGSGSFNLLYYDGKWQGSGGFKEEIDRDNRIPPVVVPLAHYPDAASLNAIPRLGDPVSGTDVKELVQRWIDTGYGEGGYIGLVQESGDVIPGGDAVLKVQWMEFDN